MCLRVFSLIVLFVCDVANNKHVGKHLSPYFILFFPRRKPNTPQSKTGADHVRIQTNEVLRRQTGRQLVRVELGRAAQRGHARVPGDQQPGLAPILSRPLSAGEEQGAAPPPTAPPQEQPDRPLEGPLARHIHGPSHFEHGPEQHEARRRNGLQVQRRFANTQPGAQPDRATRPQTLRHSVQPQAPESEGERVGAAGGQLVREYEALGGL